MSEPGVAEGVQDVIGSIAQDSGHRSQQSRQGAAGSNRQGSSTGQGGGLGALFQSLGPMMQQLAVGSSNQPSSTNASSSARDTSTASGSDDWLSALSELDEEEKAEWEKIIR